ncbi:MAG TPA: hypothetical protein VNP96_08995 [Solirubrobacterales bacterium]|nr:hypothetical protein [Solirubrobacterales bacterium]
MTLAAVFAIGGLVAPAALGQAGTFTASDYAATITGSQIGKNVLTTNAGKVECTHGTFHGAMADKSQTLTVTASYSGCQLAGLFVTTIDMNGCDYRFKAGETEAGEDAYVGTVDIVCPGSNEIVVTTSVCVIRIPSQNGLGVVTYETTAGEPDLDATLDVTGSLKYTIDSGCGPTGSGTFTNGSYVTAMTLFAEKAVFLDPLGFEISD